MAELLKATGIYYRNELRSIHKNGVKLQPVYEAFTNSWESILEKYTAEHLNLGSIVIEFHYNAGMFEEDNENNLKNLQKIIITDNGIGLNEESFTRLLNLRDNSKSKNNKGTGRIQYLHYFDDTIFESVYKVGDNNFRKICLTLSKKEAFLQANAILRKDFDEETDIDKTNREIFSLMLEAEYEYYRNNDFNAAMTLFKRALEINNFQPIFISASEICSIENRFDVYEDLAKKYHYND